MPVRCGFVTVGTCAGKLTWFVRMASRSWLSINSSKFMSASFIVVLSFGAFRRHRSQNRIALPKAIANLDLREQILRSHGIVLDLVAQLANKGPEILHFAAVVRPPHGAQ